MSTLPNPIDPSQTAAGSPINQTLMDSIRIDLDFLCDQIGTGPGGGGGGTAIADSGSVAVITQGGSDNTARFWKRRFGWSQNTLLAGDDFFDPESKETNERFPFMQENDDTWISTTSNNAYLGTENQMNTMGRINFKVKAGENFFSVGRTLTTTFASPDIQVFIDGQTPTTLGLVDENGDGALDSFTQVSTTQFEQKTEFYFGLDGKEHIVTVFNNGGASQFANITFFEAGFRSDLPTIDTNINIKAGSATGRVGDVSWNEEDLSFTPATGNGYTAGIIIDDTGDLTPQSNLDLQPAMTQVRAEQTVAFSGAVTTLAVKNNFYFPSNGIVLVSTPYGNHHMVSYTGKTDATIQAHSLDGLLWQSQPTEDFITVDGFGSTTAGDATGDLNINLWGTAPIEVTATNDKIDFTVTENGTPNTFIATLVSGRYSADLVPLGVEIKRALNAANPIAGDYIVEYSSETQLWELGIEGNPDVTTISFQFSTGPSFANSLHPTLGFPGTDQLGSLNYIATTATQHLSGRVFEADKNFMNSTDTRIKKSFVDANSILPEVLDVEERLGLQVVSMTTNDVNHIVVIYPDDDACGLAVSWVRTVNNTMLSYQVDEAEVLYLTQGDATAQSGAFVRGSIMTAFVSFPRGSRRVTIRNETETNFNIGGTTENIHFVGARQYFTKPNWEVLPLTQSVLKTFDIAPISLYGTNYGHNGGVLYAPQANDDQINTITESAPWTGGAQTTSFNGFRRSTGAALLHVDIDFTLVGDGGGIAMKELINGATRKSALFISQVAIVEGTDRIQNANQRAVSLTTDTQLLGIMGLSAGTYIARFKNDDAFSSFGSTAIVIYDTVPPQENAIDNDEINNTGQGPAFPINVRRVPMLQDSAKKNS